MTAPAPALKTAPRGFAARRRFGTRGVRQRIAELKALLAAGLDDLACCEELELTVQEYNILKREMYAQEKLDLVGKPTEEVYSDYVMHQRQCIRNLDDLIPVFKTGNQPNAIVGAIKAKSDIFNRIIETGQSFGIIEKIPEKKQIVGGILVAQLDNQALRSLIAEQLNGLKQVVGRYGNTDLFGNPIDGTAPLGLPESHVTQDPRHAAMEAPIFNGNGKPPQSVGGGKKAAGAKAVNAARRAKATPSPL